MSGLDLVCFDADDTLWHNLVHFDKAENEFARMMSRFMPEAVAKQKIISTETRNVRLYGYGVKTFTLAMIETAIEISGGAVDNATISKLVALGLDMLNHHMEILPHVEDTLKALRPNFKLLLITKGDLYHQERKVLASGLSPYFEGVEIVSEKKRDTYEKICARYGGRISHTLMAGNSVKSDVLPMIQAGGYGVYVPFEITWSHEHEELPEDTPRFFKVGDLSELPQIVANLACSLSP